MVAVKLGDAIRKARRDGADLSGLGMTRSAIYSLETSSVDVSADEDTATASLMAERPFFGPAAARRIVSVVKSFVR